MNPCVQCRVLLTNTTRCYNCGYDMLTLPDPREELYPGATERRDELRDERDKRRASG